MYVAMYIYVHIYTQVYVHVHVYACSCVCTYMYMYVTVYAYMYVCMYMYADFVVIGCGRNNKFNSFQCNEALRNRHEGTYYIWFSIILHVHVHGTHINVHNDTCTMTLHMV